jgi:pimeloyl-ACP methyl ester carboxylesterase
MTGADVILMLPGILCDADLWQDQIEAMRGQADCVVPMLGAATIEAMADEALRDAPPHFALAGLSMGGYVALAMARKAPQRISRLFLANTSARADTPEQTAGRHAGIAQVEIGGFGRVVERLLGLLVHPSRLEDTSMITRIEAMLLRVGADVFVRQQLATAGRADSRPVLGQIGVPTLVVGGDGDRVIPPDHAVEIANGVPGAELVLLKNCGHLSPMEWPQQVNEMLRRWMTG